MIHALFLAVALVSTSPTPEPTLPPMPDASQVVSIELRSGWGGLGSPREHDATIVRKNGMLSGGESTVAPLDAVARLLATLSEPDGGLAPASHFGLTLGDAEADTEGLRACVGDAADLPTVPALWLSIARDASRQRAWLHLVYDDPQMHTDDYPSEHVVITFADGSNVTIASREQGFYMLPFAVSRGGIETSVYDPALSAAIYDLDQRSANQNRLREQYIYQSYQRDLCHLAPRSLTDSIIYDYAPLLGTYIRRNGVEFLDGGNLGPALDGLSGTVHFAAWPLMMKSPVSTPITPLNSAEVAANGLAALERARHAGTLVLRIPWIRAMLSAIDSPTLNIVPWRTCADRASILALLKARAPILARAVLRSPNETVVAGVWKQSLPTAAIWTFLPDGRAVLTSFDTGNSFLGPLQGVRFAHWPAGPLAVTGRTTIAVIDRTGKLLWSAPAPQSTP